MASVGIFDRFRKRGTDARYEKALESLELMRPGFVDAVKAATENDCEQTRLAVHRVILSGSLWYPVERTSEDRGTLRAFHLPNGGVALPVYTEPESMALDGQWREGSTMISAAPLVFQMAEENGVDEVHINPAGPAGVAICKEEIPFLALGRSPYGMHRDDKPDSAKVGPPKRPLPEALLKSAIDAASAEGAAALYYADMVLDEKATYPSLSFDFTHRASELEAINQRIAERMSPVLEFSPVRVNPVGDPEELAYYVNVGEKLWAG